VTKRVKPMPTGEEDCELGQSAVASEL
jgi:hypothetical protein